MDRHNQVIDIMTKAFVNVSENNITKEEMLPALVDFTAAVALILGGELGLLAVVSRLTSRLGHWKAGEFPAPDRSAKAQGNTRRVQN